MGSGVSGFPDAPAEFPYFSLTFHWVDVFRFIHANPRTVALVKKCLEKHWGKKGCRPVTDISPSYGATDIEVYGRPFVKGAAAKETINAKATLCRVLEYLLADGWRLVCSSDMSRFVDGTTWFFQRIEGQSAKKPATVCVLCLSATDQVQLLRAPLVLFEEMKEALTMCYSQPVLAEEELGGGQFVVKLSGDPWGSENRDGTEGRRFIVETIRRFQRCGYYAYETVNLKKTADSIFFIRHPEENGWIKSGEYFMLSLNLEDRIRLVDCPAKIIGVIRTCILKFRGMDAIQRENDFHGTHEIKLRGNPWQAEGEESVESRFLLVKLLETLRGSGWKVHLGIDVSNHINDKAVIVFRKEQPEETTHFCLAPVELDQLVVVGAGEEVVETVGEVLKEYWPKGVKKEDSVLHAHRFYLRGSPFNGRVGADEVLIRSFFCFLLEKLRRMGWITMTSCDVSSKHVGSDNGPSYPMDVHSWFFAKIIS